ncbi:MAG: DUF3037 domain-containing protein [Gammaproteobacteria bacterium]|nr:MAG: DUF3037 domain-containing protein [Gammaproteobacteria bacterium]
MSKIACQYAIVRFAPFVETGEFANVGIIMMAPKQRFFAFELELKRYARITHFFEDVDAKLYRNSLYNLKDELERVASVLKEHGFDKRLKTSDIDFANGLFNEVIRTRETIVRFSEVRTVLTDDPKEKIKELFAFYIERNFATKKYQEKLLENDVRKLLYQANIGRHFEKEKLGDHSYHVIFPFVRNDVDELVKVIKPLHLGHDEPTKIYDHGAAWVSRINRLKGKFLEPERVLFTLAGPDGDGDRLRAYHDIETELRATGVRITSCDNQDEITHFALN